MQDGGLQWSFVGNGKLVKVWGRADQICTLGKNVNLCFETVSHREKINRGWETSWEGVRNRVGKIILVPPRARLLGILLFSPLHR